MHYALFGVVLLFIASSVHATERRVALNTPYDYGKFAAVGAPEIREGRHGLDPATYAAAMGSHQINNPVFFSQMVTYAHSAILAHDLDRLKPDSKHHLAAGTRLYRQGNCWMVESRSICLIRDNGRWLWREADLSVTLKDVVDGLYDLCCNWDSGGTSKPSLDFAIATPDIDQSQPPPPPFVVNLCLRWHGAYPHTPVVSTACDEPPSDGIGRIMQVYQEYDEPVDAMAHGDWIYEGGDGIGARLHYNSDDGSISVTRTDLVPSISSTAEPATPPAG